MYRMMEHKNDHLGEHALIDRLKSPELEAVHDVVSSSNSKDGESSSGKSSPDSPCAICLGRLENKSFTDSCFHTFCFTCLLEWSKVKAECPLCKQPFKSIVHNVRSIEDYDQYYINARATENSWQSPDGRRFRYPSTLTAERRRQRAFEETIEYHNHLLTYAPHTFSSSNYRLDNAAIHPSSSSFRRHIYENALFVQQGNDTQRRYRDTSPEFYCQNPACTHRLTPWLNRELVALLHDSESQVMFVLELILALIMRYDIKSPEFYVHIEPYLQNRTTHFIHEFYNFARSPYDMANYDRRAIYECVETSVDNENHSSVSSSDVVVLYSQSDSENVMLSLRNHLEPPITGSDVKFPSLEGTSQSDSVTDLKDTFWNRDKNWMNKESSNSTILSPGLESGLPGPSTLESGLPVPSDLENGLPGPSTSVHCSALDLKTSNREKRRHSSTDRESDCVIVGFVKPRSERTPELIDLVSSGSDTESYALKSVLQKSHLDTTEDKKYLKKKLKTFHERERYQRRSLRTRSEKNHMQYPSWSTTESSSSGSEKRGRTKRSKYYRKKRNPGTSPVDTVVSESYDDSDDSRNFRFCSVVGKTSTLKFYKRIPENNSHRRKHKKQKRKKHRKHKHHHKHRHHSVTGDKGYDN